VFFPRMDETCRETITFIHHGIGNYYNFTWRRRRAFVITETELNVIAALAMMGLSSRPKNGYRAAQGSRARTMPRRSPESSVMPALSIVTSDGRFITVVSSRKR